METMGHAAFRTADDAAECTCGWSGGTFFLQLAGVRRSIEDVIEDHLAGKAV